MDFKSLDELREPDKRTLHFGPRGLETGGTLRPEDAAQYQQETISHADLVPSVASSTRGTFERLRSAYAYGLLSYDLFTVVDDLVQLVVEQALRDRFLEFYSNVVPFEDALGEVHEVQAKTFDALYDEIRSENRLRKPLRWRLRLRRTGELIYFDGMLDSLLRWARGEGLLRGQRNRRRESLLKKFRNNVAHGSGDHLVMPTDTARDIREAAEIINQLWGSATPGGHFYPAPMGREVQVIAWRPGKVLTGIAGAGLPADEYPGWTCVLVRAVVGDGCLDRFDAQYETTAYPCDLLWGPGRWEEASHWLDDQSRDEDEVEVLDRLFLFQHDQDRLYLPRNPDVAAGLDQEDRYGTWYLIRADFPDDAISHARGLVLGQCKAAAGPCGQCAAEGIGVGSWQEIINFAASTGVPVIPIRPPDFRVPTLRSSPRYFEIPTS